MIALCLAGDRGDRTCTRRPDVWEGEPNTSRCFDWWPQWLSDEEAKSLGIERGDPERPREFERCYGIARGEGDLWSLLAPGSWRLCDVPTDALQRAQRLARIGEIAWLLTALSVCR